MGLPTGVVTFLFTDIEGSTLLAEHLGDDAYEPVLRVHHRVMREAIADHAGQEVSTEGDAFFVVFEHARDAAAMAIAAQRAIGRAAWPHDATVRVRMGLHTGEGRLGGDNYAGLAVNQAARVASAAHGGQVLASAASKDAAGVAPRGVSWLALGRHRLRDLGAPVELFQLCHAELAANFPPPRSLERVAHNLPIQPSSFTGRAEELEVAAKLLTATRLLTVVGPGGTGKTRLAYQLAADQLHEFPDGAWVAELASASDPELVPASLMTSLSLRNEPGRTTTQTIVAHLRHRHALVVLDNCEHVVQAAAALTVELLRRCAHLRILATTREPLRVTGERVWALPPLTLPTNGRLPLEALARTDAIALFCERAAEARFGFALDAASADAVTAICARVDGIPLAIELAASRVRTLSVAEIARRLEESFDLLSKGARGAGDRQSSLRSAISWSHHLLDPIERMLFRRLGVFVGGFALKAAEDVCANGDLGTAEVIDALAGLVDKSLVAIVDDGRRYRLLETIRACTRRSALKPRANARSSRTDTRPSTPTWPVGASPTIAASPPGIDSRPTTPICWRRWTTSPPATRRQNTANWLSTSRRSGICTATGSLPAGSTAATSPAASLTGHWPVAPRANSA